MPDFSSAKSGVTVGMAAYLLDAKAEGMVLPAFLVLFPSIFLPPVSTRRGCVIVAPKAVKIEAVSNVSTLRKLGVVTRVASKMAGQRVGRNRTLRAATGAVRTTARTFGRAANQLWLEVTGTVFLAMAAFGVTAGIREYVKYSAGHSPASHVAIAAGFTLAFAWFGLSSFWKARGKNRHS